MTGARLLPAIGLAAVVAGAACNRSATDTGVVAEVSTDLRVPDDLDQVQLSVTRAGAQVYFQSFPLTAGAGSRIYALPLRVGLVPQGDPKALFRVVATGVHAQRVVVSRSATLSFVEHQTVLLRLPLLAACAGTVCTDPSFTCVENGQCQPDAVNPTHLPVYVRGTPAGSDGGGADAPAGDGGDAASGTGGAGGGGGAGGAAGPDGGADAATDAGIALNTGLVGYWAFDQNATNFPDYSGNGNTAMGSPQASSVWIANGAFGGAVQFFDMFSALQTTSTSASVLGVTQAVTLAAFIRPGPYGSAHVMIWRPVASGDLKFDLAEGGQLRFTAGPRIMQTRDPLPQTNGWVHVAATYDGTVGSLYVGGQLAISNQLGSAQIGSGGGYGFVVGMRFDNITAESVDILDGGIDEITIYNRALNAAEIQRLASGVFPTRH